MALDSTEFVKHNRSRTGQEGGISAQDTAKTRGKERVQKLAMWYSEAQTGVGFSATGDKVEEQV